MKQILVIALVVLNNSLLFSQGNFSTGIEKIWCGNTQVLFKTMCAREQPGIQFIHVHENESTAVEAAKNMLATNGAGCFVTWEAMGGRYVNFKLDNALYAFDPNRIYTPKGRRESLNANGEYSGEADSVVANIAAIFLSNYIDSQRLIIALHNNTDGGGLTIKGFKKGGPYEKDAKKVFINNARDEDDFFLTTEAFIFNYIKTKGFNIMLQDNVHVSDDGSLSVYAANKNIPYINIEAQHGHLKEQLEMIDLVQKMICDKF